MGRMPPCCQLTRRKSKSLCDASSIRCPNASDVTMPLSRPPNSVAEASSISLKFLAAMKRRFAVASENPPNLRFCRQDGREKKGWAAAVDQRLPRPGRRVSPDHSRLHGGRSDAARCTLDQPFAACPTGKAYPRRLPSRRRGGDRIAPATSFRPTPSPEKIVGQASSAARPTIPQDRSTAAGIRKRRQSYHQRGTPRRKSLSATFFVTGGCTPRRRSIPWTTTFRPPPRA